jgi:peroxiredoxin Q/BCP
MNKLQATSNLTIDIPDTQGRNIVLYFYPKDATSGCTLEGQDFRDNHQAFTDANTVVYGVSKDTIASHEQFKSDQSFPFELIADENGALCEAFGVWQMKGEKMGIVRSTFILDAEGKTLKSWDKVAVGGHVDEVLKVAQSL